MRFHSWVGCPPAAERRNVRILLVIENVLPSGRSRLRSLGFRLGTKTRLKPDICAIFVRGGNELRCQVKRSKQNERGRLLSLYVGTRGTSSFWVRTRMKSTDSKTLSFVSLGSISFSSAVSALFSPLISASDFGIDHSDFKIVAGGRIGRLEALTFDQCNRREAGNAAGMWISPSAPDIDSDVPKFETALGNLAASLSESADIKVALNARLKFTERLIVCTFSEAV